MGKPWTTRTGTASVALIWPFLTLAERMGSGDPSPLIRRQLGLSETEFADPTTRVPSAELVRLLNQAIEHEGQRDLGLLAARFVDSVHLGVMADVTRTKPTLRTALEAGGQYAALVGDSVHYRFEVNGDVATSYIAFDPELQLHEVAIEFTVAVGLVWTRRMAGDEELAPLAVHFTHARPADTSRHEALFRCPLHFSAEITKVEMSAPSLERPLRDAEPVLASLVQRRADRMLESLCPTDTTSRVRHFLSTRHDFWNASAERVAAHLGVGVRTLGRRLQEEGTSYQQLLDEARTKSAMRALAETDRTVASIADTLGFASAQGFQRAFRKWTGLTPARYRRSMAQRRQA